MSQYIAGINQAATASTATSAAKDTQSDEILGKEDFLTLLVAQLQNQDPLNPDDPTEFTAQLAQFSSLEQLFNLNESVDGLVASNADSDRLSTLGTIGKEVTYASSSIDFEGNPVTLGYQLDGQATEVELALQMNGATVATLRGTELGEGTHYLSWDGLNSDGQPAAVGNYSVVVTAKAADGESVAANPVIRSEVTGVDLEGESGGTLITKSGEVAFNSILGVYDAGSSPDKEQNQQENSTEDVNNTSPVADTIEDTIEDTVSEAASEAAAETADDLV